MEAGDKIYVESIMSDSEWKEYGQKFGQSSTKPKFFNSEMKWRYRMGECLTSAEIELINKRINILLQRVQ